MFGFAFTLWVFTSGVIVHDTVAFVFDELQCPSEAPCYCQSDEINCEGFHLTSFPNFTTFYMPEDHFAVNLAGNSLTSIPANAFTGLIPANLTALDLFLPENRLASIDQAAFNGVDDWVVWLYLDENELTQIPVALEQLPNLEEFSIENNPIASLETSSKTLSIIGQSLQNFYISLSLFKDWPTEFQYLQVLKELYVSDVRLPNLSSNAFDGFENTLTLLSIEESEFPNIPEVVCNLPQLETFRFVNNGHLTSASLFEKCPRNMASVKHVELSTNHLHTMPNVFDMFPSVISLDLSHNLLSGIEAGQIHNYLPLSELILNYNSFTSIPTALGKLTMLETLEMEDNKVQAVVDADLSQFTHLTDLSLANNPLVSISDGAFKNNGDLTTLNLQGTHLRVLPGSLSGLAQLTTLELQQDPIACTCALGALKSWDVGQISITGDCESGTMAVSTYLMNGLRSCP